MNFDRPVLKIIPSKFDITMDSLSLIGLVFLWTITIIQYSKLPDIIPIHFSVNGKIDNYGNKATIFLLPVIITIVFAGLTWINKYPHIFNYPRKITAENAMEEYTKATRVIRIIKLIITVFTIIISFDIIESAKAGYSKLPVWIVPVFMVSMILPIFISLRLHSKNKSKKDS